MTYLQLALFCWQPTSGILSESSCSSLPSPSYPNPLACQLQCTVVLSVILEKGWFELFLPRALCLLQFSVRKNVHNSLIDGKRYCLLPCDVQLQRDTSGCLFLPFHLRGFAELCKKTRWSPCARIVLLWLCFHSLCPPKDWICTQISMHVISCFPQMWAQQNNMYDPSVWIPW